MQGNNENNENNELVPMLNSTALNYVPANFSELCQWANMVKDSALIPSAYRGKPADILIACQYGAEVGLKPNQALHGIAVINGRPSLWGDALLAVCQNSPHFEWYKEEQTQDMAMCIVKRKGYPEHKVVFTKQDAAVAGLLNKAGPWKTAPKRMLQMRARGFALRDQFADALKGFSSAEEQNDIKIINQWKETEESEKPALEAPVMVTEDQLYQINALIRDLKKPEGYREEILKKMGFPTMESMTQERADTWLKKLNDQSWKE